VRAAYRAKTIEQAADALEDPHFLFLGRLAPEKGVHDLVEAFRLVYRKQGSGHLSLVGAGPLEGALRAHIESVGLNGVVTLLGARGLLEVEPLFYRSVALVLPSNSEPWGLVVNEALSYGCPVIVSDRCGCVPELVIDGISGYSFSSGSIEGLAAAMLECLSLSKDRISTVENCLTLMSSFTPEKAAAEILRGCEAIAEGRV
jgi:glycosyltransferase involved in cell wall biosynthesis